MAGDNGRAELRPGERCAQDGLYKVLHRAHRAPHNAIVRRGELFPRCNRCGDAVRFRLLKQIGEPTPTRAKRVRKKGAGRD